jgi:hypothetical protein
MVAPLGVVDSMVLLRRCAVGMGRLALGSNPAAHTVSNDFLHIAMTLVTTLALVRLASLRK